MAGTLEAITSFDKTSEGEATGPTGALFHPVVQCIANACSRLKECELRCFPGGFPQLCARGCTGQGLSSLLELFLFV